MWSIWAVARFTAATAQRPFLAKLSAPEQSAFGAAYQAALAKAYPLAADGSVLFAFRRLFFTLMPAERSAQEAAP